MPKVIQGLGERRSRPRQTGFRVQVLNLHAFVCFARSGMAFRSFVLCSDSMVGPAPRGTEVAHPSKMTGLLELTRNRVWSLELPGL